MSKVTPAKYRVLLDSNGDETFATDLSSRVITTDWMNGMSEPYEKVAKPTAMQLTLLNDDGGLTSGAFGDTTFEDRVETLQNEELLNNSFTAFTLSEPDNWTKKVHTVGMTTSQTASGGGAGIGALHITGTGEVSYAQFITPNTNFEVSIDVSQFSGDGLIEIWLNDSSSFDARTQIQTLTGTGVHTFRMDADNLAYFEVNVHRISGTFTVTIDSVSVKQVVVSYGPLRPVERQILGDDIVTNGDFTAWTGSVPNGWTAYDATVKQVGSGQDHTGGGAGSVNLYENTSGLVAGISQTLDIVDGQRYRFDIVISHMSGTGVKVQIGSPANGNFAAFYVTFLTAGTQTLFLTAHGETINTQLRVIADARPFEATIDSVSIRPVSFVTEYVQDEESYSVAPDTTVSFQRVGKRGTLIKVLMSYAEIADEQLWIGKLERIIPTIGVDGSQTVQITCLDPMNRFQESDYVPRLQTNVTVDQALTEMLKRAPVFAFPYASSFWLIGARGSSEVGITTKLFSVPTNFETGVQTIPFIGDNQNREDDSRKLEGSGAGGVNQLQFIKDLLAVEADGRFFWDTRSSELVFHNRHHDLDPDIDAYIYGDEITGNAFIVADDVANVVTLHYQPRGLGAAGSVLWQSPSVPIRVRGRSNQKITVRYTDPDNPSVRVGAQDVIPPAQGVDWTISDTETSTVYTTNAFQVSAEIGANGATITLVNNKVRDLFVRNLQIRGTPLQTFTPTEVTVRDPDSVRANDPQPMDVQALLISDTDDAEAMARYLLGRYKTAIRRFTQIELIAGLSDKNMRNVINLTVGSRISLTVDSASHSAQYIIVGERHTIMPRDGIHKTTYILKPANRNRPWILGRPGYSELGLTTALVY